MVEWWTRLTNEPEVDEGLHLVHLRSACPYGPQGSCSYDENPDSGDSGFRGFSRYLTAFLGTDGLMSLLSMLAEGDLPKEDVLEMIKRLHIPGYEHARSHFANAISAGIIETTDPAGYYCQDEIKAVLRFIGQ